MIGSFYYLCRLKNFHFIWNKLILMFKLLTQINLIQVYALI